LRCRHLEVADVFELAVAEREYRVGAPVDRIGRAALGLRTAAPLVGVQKLRRVVAERRGMPEREVGIGDGLNAHGVERILDVEQKPVPGACTGGVSSIGIYRDVVTLGWSAARLAAAWHANVGTHQLQ